MRILFVNICEKRAYEGHRLADSEWINELALLGNVDVICPSADWYEGLELNANIIPFDSDTVTKGEKLWHSKAVNRGIIRRFNPYVHLSNYHLYQFVEKLDKKRKYAFIFAAHLDPLMFLACYWRSRITGKLFVLEHTPELYQNRYVRFCFDRTKNRIHHVTMEKLCVSIYVNQYGICRNRVHCIPHPFNRTADIKEKKDLAYDIAGLSNSNSPEAVAEIIEWEKTTGYFQKNKIKAVFRSADKNLVFNDGWLRVIAGRLNLSFDEYYSCIKNAKVLVLPFDVSFGARTSGTVIDALSNQKFCIGTGFTTMRGYSREYSSVCKVYRSVNELGKILSAVLNQDYDTESVRENFYRFEEDRSLNSIKTYMKKAFRGYI